MKLPTLSHAAVCLTALLSSLAPAAASQLDWDQNTGATFNSANGYSSNIIVDGMMVNVTVSGATAGLATDSAGTKAPVVDKTMAGGTTGPENSLVLAANFGANTQFLTVTVTFRNLAGTALLPVSGVNFNLFDIDRAAPSNTTPATYSYVDRISGIQASLGNTVLNPVNVQGTAIGNKVVNGEIIGVSSVNNTGTTSSNANALVDFGSQQLTSFTFNYGDDPSALADPGIQYVALHDINFVPEPGTNALLGAGGLLAVGAFLRRRKRGQAVG